MEYATRVLFAVPSVFVTVALGAFTLTGEAHLAALLASIPVGAIVGYVLFVEDPHG